MSKISLRFEVEVPVEGLQGFSIDVDLLQKEVENTVLTTLFRAAMAEPTPEATNGKGRPRDIKPQGPDWKTEAIRNPKPSKKPKLTYRPSNFQLTVLKKLSRKDGTRIFPIYRDGKIVRHRVNTTAEDEGLIVRADVVKLMHRNGWIAGITNHSKNTDCYELTVLGQQMADKYLTQTKEESA